MGKGYVRLVEATLLMLVMFSLLIFMMNMGSRSNINPGNPYTLERYCKDLANMVCESSQARELALSGNLTSIYKDLVYTIPPEYKLRVIVGPSEIGNVTGADTVISCGCVISDMEQRVEEVTVQVGV